MLESFLTANYTEVSCHNNDVVSSFSPNGERFVSAVQCQVLIWEKESKKIINKFICEHSIDGLGWSPDSKLIYCVAKKQGIIEVWNLNNPYWKCKVDETPLAIVDVFWTPDSSHLLIVAEFHLKITVWSLVSNSTTVIENPKHVKNCVAFSPCERFFALARRRKCEDYISIYNFDTFENLKSFSVDTKDLSGIYFSPSELTLAILEAATVEPKVLFYCIDGRLVGKYSISVNFGFTTLSWRSDGRFVAVGDYSGQVTLLHPYDYSEAVSYQISENIDSEEIIIYKVASKREDSAKTAAEDVSNLYIYEVIKQRPFSLASFINTSDRTKVKIVKCGIKVLSFSSCGRFLAAVSCSMPKIVSIFDVTHYRVSSVIIHQYNIKDVAWHPELPILAICSGSSSVDFWTPSCCICVSSPFEEDFSINNADWCSQKDCLMLNSKNQSSVLYLPKTSVL